MWAGSFHRRNTHVATVTRPPLEEAWVKLPPEIREVRVRADAAFYDHKTVEWHEGRGAGYVILACLTPPLQRRVGSVRYHPVSGAVLAADSPHTPQGSPRPRCLVAIRWPAPDEPSWRLHLFQLSRCTYQVFVTNTDLTPLFLWLFYKDRSQAELIIRQLKEAYALRKIPTGEFAANIAFFHPALLA